MFNYSTAFASLATERRIGFCPFAVLGDPTPTQCLKRIEKYLEARPDFLELGIPFSDPIADGPVIQAADVRALKAGMTPKKAIELIKKIRAIAYSKSQNVPIGILTYSNIVIKYGIEKFYSDLKNAGANSVLIADVSLEEIQPFASAAHRHKIHQIFLISEYTDNARLKKIEKIARKCGPDKSGGFLYVVSTLGVTGTRTKLNPQVLKLIKTLKKKTKIPLIVGFGISNPQHIQQLKKAGADGAVVGSALVKTPYKKLQKFLSSFTQQ